MDPTRADEMLSHLKTEFVDKDADSKVSAFYANRSVFITGATGFIGKAIVEKLLRSCSDIKCIYLLIREKRNVSIKDRLDEFRQSQIFNRIKSTPDGGMLLRQKLKPIKGDITLPRLGVSSEDMAELTEEISIVFNSAATIRFSEPIEVAVRNNIASVEQLVEFCDGLKKLDALIHLSTAYSNCHKKDTIFEVFYEPPMRGDQIIEAIQTIKRIQNQLHTYSNSSESNIRETVRASDGGKHMLSSNSTSLSSCDLQRFYKQRRGAQGETDDLLAEFTQIALERSNRPNTYTFTKAISERFLLDLVQARPDRYLGEGQIPVAIVRPSIVGGAWREPEVGFVDNYNGPTGAILSLYTGALQAMPGKGQKVADLVPIDMVSSMIISAGWFLGNQKEDYINGVRNETRSQAQIIPDKGAYIFNFVSGCRNPLRWSQVTSMIAELAYKYPSKQLVRLPSSYFIRAGWMYDLYDTLNHTLPAMLQDWIKTKLFNEKLTKRTSSLVTAQKIRQMTETLTPFTSNQWKLCDANVCALFNRLSEADRGLFQFDVSNINWTDYIRNYIIGSRIYTLQDDAKNVPQALNNLRKRQRLRQFALILLFALFYYFLIHGRLGVAT